MLDAKSRILDGVTGPRRRDRVASPGTREITVRILRKRREEGPSQDVLAGTGESRVQYVLRGIAAAAGAVGLLLVPLTVDRGESMEAEGASLSLRVADACAQGHGCAWGPDKTPECPDLPDGYYCNFGCDEDDPFGG